MRKILLLAVLTLVAVPTAFAANSGQTPPNTVCKAQRDAIGMKAFKLLYGSNNAYGKCVSKAASAASQNTSNASKLCSAERADATFAATHGKTFDQFYGTGHGNNAFGKCVSSKAQTLQQEQQQATISAAKTCKAERAQMGAGPFTAKYGGRSNA